MSKENFDAHAYVNKLFGDENPIEIVYNSIIKHKDELPSKFVIHSGTQLSVPEDDNKTRKFLLDMLMEFFLKEEDYLKCNEVQAIKNILNYE